MTKLINLSKGYVAIVDDCDYEYLRLFKWSADDRGTRVYARRREGGKTIYMHRVVLNAPDELLVDHANGNGVDNRRANLRPANHADNRRNQRFNLKNTSGFTGVGLDKRNGRWKARIRVNRTQKFLGSFIDPADAAKAYDAAAVELFGQFASLNFPKAVA